ncbi:Transmembrane ascorbate ferrireductase 1 [Linum grandiflorum]
MALTVKALPFTFAAHLIGIAAAVMVLVWCIHFRGGLAWQNTNKNLIFNVSSKTCLSDFLGCYKSLPLKKEAKKLTHLILHGVALILGIIGIYTAFKFHNESGIDNLYSLHSWLGILVISLYGIQVTEFSTELNTRNTTKF